MSAVQDSFNSLVGSRTKPLTPKQMEMSLVRLNHDLNTSHSLEVTNTSHKVPVIGATLTFKDNSKGYFTGKVIAVDHQDLRVSLKRLTYTSSNGTTRAIQKGELTESTVRFRDIL